MTFKIAICGAPGSGKTTFAARLYADLLESGVSSTKLITEYAQDYLGKGLKIDTIKDQQYITQQQYEREQYAANHSYSPLICDSPIWIGAVYLQYNYNKNPINTEEFLPVYSSCIETYNDYDTTIYVPMFDTVNSRLNRHRIHDVQQALTIDTMIYDVVKKCSNVYTVSEKLSERHDDVKRIIDSLKHFF